MLHCVKLSFNIASTNKKNTIMKNNNNNKNIEQIWEEIFQMKIQLPKPQLEKSPIKMTDKEFETFINWKKIGNDLNKMLNK